MSKHSIYSPSSSERWINCPGSIKVTKQFKNGESEAALEGTAAHWLFEHCMNNAKNPSEFIGNSLTATSDSGQMKKQFEIDRDFADNTSMMVDYCRLVMQTPGTSVVEQRLDLSHIEKDFFGAGDFCHDSSAHDGVLTVVDLKFGRVGVDVANNTQLLCYGSGALNTPAACKNPALVRWLRLVIVQPRSVEPGPRIKEVIIPVEHVRQFEQTLANAIARTKEETPALATGRWCRYCPALGICPKSTDMLSMVGLTLNIDPQSASDAQLSTLLQTEKLVEQVMKNAKKETERRLLDGRTMPNLFLATSVKYRKWADEDAAMEILKTIPEGKALRPKTPAQVEKLGEEAKSLVARLTVTPPGEPVAAVVGDRRKPYTTRNAAEIFKA